MEKYLHCLGIVFCLLFFVSCKPKEQNFFIPTSTVNPTKTPIPANTQQAEASLTPAATYTVEIPSSPSVLSQWGDQLRRVSFNGSLGEWSKTSHAFLFNCEADKGLDNLCIAMGPDFTPKVLRSDISFDDFTWSPDGQFILFSTIQGGITKNISMVKADGSNPDIINEKWGYISYGSFNGWIDQHSLIFTDSWLSLLNIETGDKISLGVPTKYHHYYPSYNFYIPVAEETGEFDPRLLVIKTDAQIKKKEEGLYSAGKVTLLPEYKSIPRNQTMSNFLNWLPNKNQMLVSWSHFDYENYQSLDNDLLLWDLDNNHVQVIAPDGLLGEFSPDGKVLAYFTNDPAQLDGNSKAVKGKSSPSYPFPNYLQLLDMSSGKVILSTPGINAQFSPDSRYLLFISPSIVESDSSGWPSSLISTSIPTINLLDLQEKQLIWASETTGDSEFFWSPVDNLFIYQDEYLNWQLFYLLNQSSIPITLFDGESIKYPDWSFDGKYLSLWSCLTPTDQPCNPTVTILDVQSAINQQ